MPTDRSSANAATLPTTPSGWIAEIGGALVMALAAAGLLAVAFWMQRHDWEYGRERSALIALCALLVFVLRWPSRPLRFFSSRALIAIAWIAMATALGLDLRVGLESVTHVQSTGEIRLDQGQNLLRSSQLLLRGEDPYGRGALVDLEAYSTRFRSRVDAGLTPQIPREQIRGMLARYAFQPDPQLRELLLPTPSAPRTPDAELEYSLLGHKYGPLPVLLVTPFVQFGRACIPALQLVAFFGWIAALLWMLRSPALRLAPGAIPIALMLVLIEPHVAHNYLYDSASDAWGLAFCALALGAHLRDRRLLSGVAVALALACKIFPAALFLPLLVVGPWPSIRRAGLACVATLAVLFGPFLLWDAHGLWLNLVAWPSLMAPDNTGWISYVPTAASTIRLCLTALLAVLSLANILGLRPARGQSRLWAFVRVDSARLPAHFALASACAVLAGSAFHNNYVPWVTSWSFCAITIAFASSRESSSAPAVT